MFIARIVLSLILFCLINIVSAQSPYPKYEFRGVWIATVSNIDWPSQPGLKPEKQRAEFIELLDFHKSLGLNAVVVQVRAASDAFYQSEKEPWSYWLTGKQGKAPRPFYDPLEFMIHECHKRNMEFHAWINPFRATINESKVHKSHITETHPEWIISYAGQKVVDPGIPEAREYIVGVIDEIITKYDVDAIHFDDYFYPYPENGTEFPDLNTFKKHKNGFKEINDWRRNNIDVLIQSIHQKINETKPKVKFGISPFGIWRNKMSDSLGSATYGLPSYDAIYADSRKWLSEGWIDYIVPQIYWSQNNKAANYDTLTEWWSRNSFGKHLYIGHAPYKIDNDSKDESWNHYGEIPNQIRKNRELKNVKGSVFFSSRVLKANKGNVSDSIKNAFFSYPALIPPMKWKDSIPPEQPENLKVEETEKGTLITWNIPEKASDGELPYAYIVYRFSDDNFSTKNPKTIAAIVNGNSYSFLDTLCKQIDSVEYGVTAIDRCSNESSICLKSKLLAESKIREVTLYLDKAVIARECKTMVGSKPVAVKIEGLPLDIDYSTISVEAQAPVELISFKHGFYYPEPKIDTKKKEQLFDSIQMYKHKIGAIKDSLEVLEKTEDFLLANQNVTNSNVNNVTLEGIMEFSDFFESKLFALKNLQRELNETLETINHEYSNLQKEYTLVPVNTEEKKSLVEIAVVAPTEMEADLKISYKTTQAGWKPEYNFKTTESQQFFELEYFANVWQNTGADWQNIKLNLATLDNTFEKGQRYWKEPINFSLKPKDSIAEKDMGENSEFKYKPISMHECPLPVFIQSKDENMIVKIKSEYVPQDFIHKVIPSKSLNVIKMARLYDWEKLDMYPGKMNLFYNNMFVNSFNLELNQDTIAMIVKDEPLIKISTETISQEKKGFPASVLRKQIEGNSIEAYNKSDRVLRLIIEEPLPYAKDKRIKIKPTPSSKAGFIKTKSKFYWDVMLQPSEKHNFDAAYYINHPRNFELHRN